MKRIITLMVILTLLFPVFSKSLSDITIDGFAGNNTNGGGLRVGVGMSTLEKVGYPIKLETGWNIKGGFGGRLELGFVLGDGKVSTDAGFNAFDLILLLGPGAGFDYYNGSIIALNLIFGPVFANYFDMSPNSKSGYFSIIGAGIDFSASFILGNIIGFSVGTFVVENIYKIMGLDGVEVSYIPNIDIHAGFTFRW